jgi:hypothetical protein
MPMYLTRFSYTPETWARMIENPEDRRKAARAYIESVGGKLHGLWYVTRTTHFKAPFSLSPHYRRRPGYRRQRDAWGAGVTKKTTSTPCNADETPLQRAERCSAASAPGSLVGRRR